jgi:hypothetical protein
MIDNIFDPPWFLLDTTFRIIYGNYTPCKINLWAKTCCIRRSIKVVFIYFFFLSISSCCLNNFLSAKINGTAEPAAFGFFCIMGNDPFGNIKNYQGRTYYKLRVMF